MLIEICDRCGEKVGYYLDSLHGNENISLCDECYALFHERFLKGLSIDALPSEREE